MAQNPGEGSFERPAQGFTKSLVGNFRAADAVKFSEALATDCGSAQAGAFLDDIGESTLDLFKIKNPCNKKKQACHKGEGQHIKIEGFTEQG